MSKKRKRHSAQFKARVALEAVKGLKTSAELAREYQVHPIQISQWKRQLLEELPEVFRNGKGSAQSTSQELTAPLYEEIGRLKMELDWVKKVLPSSTAGKRMLIQSSHPEISIARQCELIALPRSSYYVRSGWGVAVPSGVDADDRRAVSVHAIFRLAADDTLAQEPRAPSQPQADPEAHANDGIRGHGAGPATQPATPGEYDLPVSAAGPGASSLQPGVVRGHYVCAHAGRVHVSGGHHRLVLSFRSGLAVVEHDRHAVLPGCPVKRIERRYSVPLQHRPGLPVRQQ